MLKPQNTNWHYSSHYVTTAFIQVKTTAVLTNYFADCLKHDWIYL